MQEADSVHTTRETGYLQIAEVSNEKILLCQWLKFFVLFVFFLAGGGGISIISFFIIEHVRFFFPLHGQLWHWISKTYIG